MSSLIYSQGTSPRSRRSLHSRYPWVNQYFLGLISLLTLASLHPPMVSQALGYDSAVLMAQATSPSGRPTLRPGSQGSPVSEVQAILQLLGYYTGSVDGLYQDSTVQAVTAFQRAAGIQADGIVGPGTWQKLLPQAPGATAAAPSPTPAASPTPASSPAPTATQTPAATRTPTPASSPAASSSTTAARTEPVALPILRVGMRGPAVERLQERLRALGYFDGAVDGVFGPQTQEAVQEAQRNSSLDPDGVVGPATWTAILRE